MAILDEFINTSTDYLDGFFGIIPFHTFENNITSTVEVTSRKTQAGFEDNDHRYEKPTEFSLEIVFFGLGNREKYLMVMNMLHKREKDTLILLKKYQIYDSVVITQVNEVEKDEDNNWIVLKVNLKEIRHGLPRGSLLQKAAENTTTSASELFQQTVGTIKEKLKRAAQIHLGGA